MLKLLAVVLLFLGIYSTRLLWRFKRDPFLAEEADRCLNHFCEVDKDWNSNGRVYVTGLAVIEENGKKRFVKQKKLFDLGILE